mmetsp:Transcript_822/g.1981  ORF Transcript_822/g.1981 Transcript_822/m.1981 type:complete len:513 (+) Transcript_822:139-1677(+)
MSCSLEHDDPNFLSESGWREYWDLEGTGLYCHNRRFRRVGLQFPDDLLVDAPKVVKSLQEEIDNLASLHGRDFSCQVYLMADTSYNPSCVDEVAAAHANADAIVHYGPACMCPLSRLPARYVFGRKPLCADSVARALAEIWRGASSRGSVALVVFTDQVFVEHVGKVEQELSTLLPDQAPAVVFARIAGVEAEPASELAAACSAGSEDPEHAAAGFRWTLPEGVAMADCEAAWVGPPGSDAKRHLQLTHSLMRWSAVDPGGGPGSEVAVAEGVPPEVPRLLRRRYFLVEKAREAAIVGLLVGTLGVAGYRSAIAAVRGLTERAGKTCYMFLVGKPSPAKLANFPEIEVFMMVGCPQGLVLDSKEYYAPVITPHEAYIAFTGRDWDPGSYRLDFADLLRPEGPEQQAEQRDPRMSFMSGGTRLVCQPEEGGGGARPSQADANLVLAERPQDTAVVAAQKSSGALQVVSAAEYLSYRRGYKGLETPATGAPLKPVEKAVEGMKGRAAGYAAEPH